jgi:hypothetical protein
MVAADGACRVWGTLPAVVGGRVVCCFGGGFSSALWEAGFSLLLSHETEASTASGRQAIRAFIGKIMSRRRWLRQARSWPGTVGMKLRISGLWQIRAKPDGNVELSLEEFKGFRPPHRHRSGKDDDGGAAPAE